VWVAARPELGPSRLGMAIRSEVGTAVERNRLRRRLREIFRSLELVRPADVVVAASSEAAGRNFHDLRDVTRSALRKTGALA
jgi:ribonuclease P protein component